jgi:N6-adenosine-specific RNA methylase IME4
MSGDAGALLVDPPWTWISWSKTNQTRAAENHYSVMTLDDIKALPVSDLAAPDCALFLWAIDPMIPQALEVIKAWGFVYKTVAFTWAKTTRRTIGPLPRWHLGLGYWTRKNPEMCLLATKGKPKRLARNVRQLIVSPVRQHSRKPAEQYERIEALVAGPYCELFARETRPGWTSLGDEVGKYDAQDDRAKAIEVGFLRKRGGAPEWGESSKENPGRTTAGVKETFNAKSTNSSS